MTSAELLAEKANRCLPPGFKAFTQYLLPYQDMDGNWHEPLADNVGMRIRRDPFNEALPFVVDALVIESDEQMPDEHFRERIIRPMLASIAQYEREGK